MSEYHYAVDDGLTGGMAVSRRWSVDIMVIVLVLRGRTEGTYKLGCSCRGSAVLLRLGWMRQSKNQNDSALLDATS